MAIPSDCVWEVRNTVGSINNGGGFSTSTAAGTGVDYSQQTSPQASGSADLNCPNTTTFTSSLALFTSFMKGNVIHVNGWGDFVITSVTDSNHVVVDRAPGGTITNGNWAVGGCKQLSNTLATVLAQMVAGNKAWIKVDGNYGFPIVPPVSGGVASPLIVEGYGTTRGDALQPTIKCTNPGGALGNYIVYKNLILDGNGAAGTVLYVSSGGCAIINCVVQNGAANAIVKVVTGPVLIDRCVIICTAPGMNDDTLALHDTTFIHNTKIVGSGSSFSCVGISGGLQIFDHCVFANSSNDGVYISSFLGSFDYYTFDSCAFWNNARSGIRNYAASSIINNFAMHNCIFGKNVAYDIDYQGGGGDQSNVLAAQDWMNSQFINNFFYTTGTGRYHWLPTVGSDIALSGDPFVDSVTTLNFELNVGSTAGQTVISNPWKPAWADGVNVGRFTAGPLGEVAGVAPTTPTTLTATVLSSSSVLLNWINTATNATSNSIERSTNGGSYVVIASVAASVTTYTDATVLPNNVYTYRVAAVNTTGESAYTNTATVVIPSFIPGASAPVIDEVQFPTDNSEGTSGGPSFSTIVTSASTGFETRVPMWRVGKYKFTIIYTLKSPAKMIPVVAFFIARAGKARGFRFKDWSDFQTTNEPLNVTGSKFVQLIKTYTSGPISYVRNIYKPQQNQVNVTLQRNNINYSTFTLDTTTGVVTLTADSTKTITGITQASQAVVTANAHGFSNGDYIYFENVQGMADINGLVGVIQSSTTNTFTVNINSTNFAAYSAGGSAEKFIQPTETLTWTGEFDVPVRFDTDEMDVVQTASTIQDWQSVQLVEVLN